jgi:hypothetical protein
MSFDFEFLTVTYTGNTRIFEAKRRFWSHTRHIDLSRIVPTTDFKMQDSLKIKDETLCLELEELFYSPMSIVK